MGYACARRNKHVSAADDSQTMQRKMMIITQDRLTSHALRGRGIVVQYTDGAADAPGKHESVTRTQIAAKLAALKGYEFAGDYDPARRYTGPLYFVPSDTLTTSELVQKVGIRDHHDLFGGVVPYPFAATKTITHPLVSADAFAPEGWSHEFARSVEDVVLFGFSAFTPADLRRAAARVMARGRARIKPARGVGGRGQTVITSTADLDATLDATDPAELANYGAVIEQNFDEIETYSVGQTYVADVLATYYGRQLLTKDNRGANVYGGSDLSVVRGDYDDLLSLELPPGAHLAINNARAYEAAAINSFAGWFASRRNYDVAQVVGDDGRRSCGVLEQSWRIGGASAAEIAALEAFRADSRLRAVRAACIEVYGEHQVPSDAVVNFRGLDDRLGPITKYTRVERYDNSRCADRDLR